MDDNERASMVELQEQLGIDNTSELVRRSLQVYIYIKTEERNGRVLVMMPSDQVTSTPLRLPT